ncbi:hypothetical protein FQR65_LT13981 [Abscondita terminalis]|nr:hypothetical protein FQR65_LT13981 [Abscondita terminalis]
MSAKRLKLDEEGILFVQNNETDGFDLEAGQTWIYPTNYSLREYQFSIIQEALFKNTMVSLPTGLGKTFIAAVVMYNFHRWYPTGKIIFMAPTRPLVKQQVDACYNIMAIPKEVTAELTGNVNDYFNLGTKIQESRKTMWNEKCVFFITPQVLQNDLDVLRELGMKIKCLIIDEAHKAKGNHAYCEVIRKLMVYNKCFRVLALSATPGNTVNDVTEVIDNLLIAHLEFRTDESADVVPYIYERSLETVVVPLDDMLIRVREDYIQVEKYTRVLMDHKLIMGNCSNITKGKIYMTMKRYQETNRQNRDRNYNEIMKYLTISHTLYYAFELLLRHGLRSFLLFFQDRVEKSMLSDNAILNRIIQYVQEYMGPLLNIETLPDGSITGIPPTVKFGHPKFYKLRDITCSHFRDENNTETRVIIFCEYRETVIEAYGILSLNQPLIKPRIFMGKSSITQKQQLSVAFRDGTCNTLISTCIGEEGIDVGNVDLIICFDINNKSPIRMIQRMGRTGRKRQGRVVILVTEGREQQTLKECLIQKQSLNHHILQTNAFHNLYKENPRMIPTDLEPKCNKIFITVKQEKNQKDMFKTLAEEKKNVVQNSDCELNVLDVNDRLPAKMCYWDKDIEYLKRSEAQDGINFVEKINSLRMLHPIGFINHSSTTDTLVSLLQSCESKKFNIPTTQTLISTLKQTDIRNMLVKSCSSRTDVNAGSQSIDVAELYDANKLIDKNIKIPLNTIEPDANNNCKICTHLFDCTQYYVKSNLEIDVSSWTVPDLSILDSINEESLLGFQQVSVTASNIEKEAGVTDDEPVLNATIKNLLEDTLDFVDSPFKAPKNLKDILHKSAIFDSPLPKLPLTQIELNNKKQVNENILSLNMNEFDKFEFTQLKQGEVSELILSFFGITSLDEIFDDPFGGYKSDTTILYSPDAVIEQGSNSPILSCQKNRSTQVSRISHRKKRRKISFSSDDSVIASSVSSLTLTNTCNKDEFGTIDVSDIADLSLFGLNNSVVNRHKYETSPVKLDDNSSEELFSDDSENDHKSKSQILRLTKTNASDTNRSGKNDCMDTVAPTEELLSKHQDVQRADESTITDGSRISEVIDLTSDNSLSSPSTSPSLLKTQRPLSQKPPPLIRNRLNFDDDDDLIEEPNMKVAEVKSFPKSLLALKKTNHVASDVTKSCASKELSPVLNRHEVTNDSFTVKKTVKKLDFSDDDDDFDLDGKKDVPWIRPKPTTPKLRQAKRSVLETKKRSSKNTVQDCIYVDLEAEVSGSNSESEEGSCFDDSFEKSFVDDNSENFLNTTVQHARYLRSVKDTDRGQFKIPQRPVSNVNVYSQVEDMEDNSYLNVSSSSTYIARTERNRALYFNYGRLLSNDILVVFILILLSDLKLFASDVTKSCASKELSPVLNRHEVTNDSFTVKKTVKKLDFSDDDDDFDLDGKKDVPWIRPKPTTPKLRQAKRSVLETKKRSSKNTVQDCIYVDLEAEVSGSNSESEEGSCFDDSFEKSFVDDNSENFLNTTVQHARYLRSVKDTDRGQFKIPQRPVSNVNVYSQVEDMEDNSYLNDTFCVHSQEAEPERVEELSELEIAEIILAERKKKNKAKRKFTK